MVELRWTTPEGTTTKPATLQWRSRVADPWGKLTLWTDWQDVPTVAIPKQSCAHDFARCTEKLRAQGLAYPRTCAECGLGPCRAKSEPPNADLGRKP